MERRDFLQTASLGILSTTLPQLPFIAPNQKMGIVVHSYASRWKSKIVSTAYPSFTNAIDLLDHATAVNAGGIQVMVNDWTTDFAKKVRDKREKAGLYLEGSIGLPKKAEDIASFESQVLLAKEAGAQILRTVTLGPRRYETFKTVKAWQDFQKQALFSLQLAEPILARHKIKLAVENHKDFRSLEMLQLLKSIESEYIGVTLDFGNNIALLEDSLTVTERLAPYVLSTHIKDMAVQEYDKGFLLSEVPMGTGICDLNQIVSICKKHNPSVTFNLEMITRDPLEIPVYTHEYWATFEDMSATELASMLMLIKQKKANSLPKISNLADEAKLKVENDNIVECVKYSREKLGMI